jgi:hypothetical protein
MADKSLAPDVHRLVVLSGSLEKSVPQMVAAPPSKARR